MKLLKFNFRWPVKQIGEKQIEVQIPTSANGQAILNPSFVEAQHLSDGELETAEFLVLESIAIVK